MKTDVLANQPVDGMVTVVRGATGTLAADTADSGSIAYARRLAEQSKSGARGRLSQRVRGHAEATGEPCTCAMPTTRRGMADATCVVCGGDLPGRAR
jgi:hypothetical protein